MNTSQLNEILKLSVDERIDLVELIWESISSVPEKIELTEAQKQELESRLFEYHKNPDEGVTLKELLEEIRNGR